MYIFDKQLIKKSQKNKITSILIYFIIIQFSTIFETTSPYFPHTLYIYIYTHSIQFFQGLEGRGERRGQTMPRYGYRLLLLPAQLAARWRLFGKVSTRLPLLSSPPTIQWVLLVVNRVIFPSCPRPTPPHALNASSTAFEISQLQLNYRPPPPQ